MSVPERKKRKSISVSKKPEIFKYKMDNTWKKQTEAAGTFELSKQTLNSIANAKSKLVEGAGICSGDRKRFRSNN